MVLVCRATIGSRGSGSSGVGLRSLAIAVKSHQQAEEAVQVTRPTCPRGGIELPSHSHELSPTGRGSDASDQYHVSQNSFDLLPRALSNHRSKGP